jgi:hypothetical protein
MLSLEKPAIKIGSLLVMGDHADPGAFYYAAPDPQISRSQGRLMFDIFAYAVELQHSPLSGTKIPDELGAGFLTLGVDCSLDDATHSSTVAALATRAGLPRDQISLSPIPYTKGSVSLIALDAAAANAPAPATPTSRPRFIEQVLGGGTPSLLGDLRAIFSLSLSQQGVVFLEGLYADGAAPVGVVYNLTFLGLRPAVQAEVSADLSRVYLEFAAKASVTYQWFRVEVEGIISKLEEQSVIQVHLTSQAVGEEATKAKELAMSLFKDRIIQAFFQPTAIPQVPNMSIPGVGDNKAAPISLSLRVKKTEELKHTTYRFDEQSPEERTHAPQGFLAVLLGPDELKARIHQVDLQSPFFELLEVLVTGPTDEEFAALDLRQVTADLTYGTPGDAVAPESDSLVFRPGATGDKTFAVKRRGRPSLAYALELTYEFSRSASTNADVFTYRVGPTMHTGRTLSIRPYDDVGVLDVEVELGQVDPSVRQVDVQLDYADATSGFAARHFVRLVTEKTSRAEERRWQVRTRQQGDRTYTATATWTFTDGATLVDAPRSSTDSLLRLDTPFKAARSLLIQPNVSAADVTRIDVEVQYDDEAAAYHRRFSTALTPAADTHAWASTTLSWPILDASRQRVRYRVTTLAGGTADATDWTESDEPSLVVGETGRRMRSLEVRLIGPKLADVGLDAVEILVGLPGQADDAATTLFFDPTSVPMQAVKLPATETIPPGFRYQIIAFHSDGSRKPGSWQATTSPLVVVQTRSI